MSGNQLLARLPDAEFERLRPYLQPVRFDAGLVLYEAHAQIEFSYFPLHGSISAVVVMLDGSMIEVATIGNEGMVGAPNINMAATSPNRVFVQVPGAGLKIEARILEREVNQSSILRSLLNAYHSAFLFQISQSVACNGLHPLLERCCRWLLMTHDRAESDTFQLTHEFLACMLGVRRPSVTETLQTLQEQGLISGSRGKISIVNRAGLEAGSCECYRAVANEYRKQLNS